MLDGLAGAAIVQVQGSVLLGIDEDDLEGWIVRSAVECAFDPFDALAGIVLGEGEEVVQVVAAEALDLAILAPPFGAMEIVANLVRQLVKAGIVHRGGVVTQVFALAPIGQGIGVVEIGRPFPPVGVIQVGGQGTVVMIGQPGQGLLESGEGRRISPQLPVGLVDDGLDAFVAAQGKNALEVDIQPVPVSLGQALPGSEESVGTGLRQGREIQIQQQALLFLEETGQEGIRGIAEKAFGGIVSSSHSSSLRGRAVRAQLIGLRRTLGYITRLL